jgi:hypothetical protein
VNHDTAYVTMRVEEQNNQSVLIVVSGETEVISATGERLPVIRTASRYRNESKASKVERE